MPFKAARNFSPLWRLASSIASRVSFVNLQKLTFQAGGASKHEDVRARARDALLQARDDDRAHLGMFEADPLDGIRQLDVDPRSYEFQLQPVVGPETAVFLDVHRQRRDSAVERQLPVDVTRGIALEVDRRHVAVWLASSTAPRMLLALAACQGSIVPYCERLGTIMHIADRRHPAE
jgi:hypothetical protein